MSRAEPKPDPATGRQRRASPCPGRSWLGGRPPHGYRIGDLGPHPNPSKAASGARLHQLEVDPEAAPVVQRIYAMYLAGAGYKQIATALTDEGVPCPSRTTGPETRTGPATLGRCRWCGPSSPIPAISASTSRDAPRRPTSCSTPTCRRSSCDRQQWQDRSEWVTSSVQTYDAIVDEATWHRVQAVTASNTRTNAVTPGRRKTHVGVRHAELSRYPLAGLVVCDCCGKKLQGNMVRGHALYRCYMSKDYPVPVNNHPPSLSVREDRLLPHIDSWLGKMFAPERIAATAREVVQADAEGHREDPAVVRARAALMECERKLAKHLDGLEAGIPAEVIAPG